jgi:hypothetical protein
MAIDQIVMSGLILVGRNVYGWLTNSMADGKIQDYEWKQLGKTLFTLGGAAVFAYMGINAVVADVSPENTTALVALVSLVVSEAKKLFAKKK